MKKTLVAMAVAAGLGASGMAQSALVPGPVPFHLDGAGATLDLNTITYLAGNTLFDNVIKAGGISQDSSVKDPFTFLYQSKVGLFNTDAGGKMSAFEYTVQISVPMEAYLDVSGVQPQLNFNLRAGMTGTYKLFFDSTPDSNDVTGLGYGDGTAVLTGTVFNANGAAQNSGGSAGSACATTATVVNIDQTGGLNNLPNVKTICTTGSTILDVSVDTHDVAHFPDFPGGALYEVQLNINPSLNNPFTTVNPSRLVVGVSPNYGNGTTASGTISGSGSSSTSNRTGTNNLLCEDDPANAPCDFHAQSDASTSFRVVVPEPGSLALLGLGLAGLAGVTRRRRQA